MGIQKYVTLFFFSSNLGVREYIILKKNREECEAVGNEVPNQSYGQVSQMLKGEQDTVSDQGQGDIFPL